MSRTPWTLLLTVFGGLAAGALIVGGAWLFSATGTHADQRPINAPTRIGAFLRFDKLDVAESGRPDVQRMVLARNEKSSQRLSQSHGGAAAFVQLYYGRDLRQQLNVQIYRDYSEHPLFVPYEDSQRLRLAKPSQSAEEFGEVSCLVRNDPVPAGQTPGPEAAHTTVCARTKAALTVEIRPIGGLSDEPGQIAFLVDELWDAIT